MSHDNIARALPDLSPVFEHGYATRLEILQQEVRSLSELVHTLVQVQAELKAEVRLLRRDIVTHILKGVPVHPDGPNAGPFPEATDTV